MKLLEWLTGGSNAPARAKETLPKEVPQRGAPVQRIAIHGTGTLRDPGLRTDCPFCKASLADPETNEPRLRFDTDETTYITRMSCPHCNHELSKSDLLRPAEPPPAAAAPAQPAPAAPAADQPRSAATATGGESVMLRVKNEETARNLCNDQYFLLGALMGDSSSDAQRFLAALQRGGTYRYEVRRDSASGECEVKLWMRS